MTLSSTALILAAVHFAFGIVFLKARISDRLMRFVVSFSAGTLLAVSLAHILPEAVELLGERTGLPVLAGFFALWAVEHLVGSHEHTDNVQGNLHAHDHDHGHGHHHAHSDDQGPGPSGLSILASLVLILHGLIDGMALASVGQDAGWNDAMLIGLSAHAPALMLALVTLLRLSGLDSVRSMIVIIIAGAVIPVGAFLGVAAPNHALVTGVPQFQAFIAGSLVYLSTHHLLPAVEHQKRDRLGLYSVALVGAIITMVLVGLHHRWTVNLH